jgi:hypothetical protein
MTTKGWSVQSSSLGPPCSHAMIQSRPVKLATVKYRIYKLEKKAVTL